ncbi:Pimeloyl-ACP methyl ester carboxylesterase [Actinokineospora alba]|uniref:Pimeloyl-ACP methyl ester carboxylesterase n=1 Tax=Actinokineospora alba TaxID=504798 RepID=A0A1H0QMG8_9PSEU|nr:alpha/beta hydrolase [Actinokineospora alba]TDP70478.1 pimeloyl-ACP methyl ester carboxylesterase [Actinokineospora alba]SDI30621.1 Pimeloyl-ACP methyl ester carboxylesterase [Actinokineospora alba]SDP18581.1 Pimeloyl-ACP methyl ester carboxylesterase [Actinokineospora alba]
MPIADLGDRKLHYIRRGEGAPLLLIQGMAGHHAIWGEPFLSLLEQHYDVLAFDHRGIGESDRADEPFTVAEMAQDAAKLMAAVGWDHAHVLGISMGGMVAQELAVRHRDRVRTLTLGCTYAGPDGGSLRAPGPLRMVEAMNTGDVAKILRAGYEANLSPAFRADESRFTRFTEVSLSVRVPSPVILLQFQAILQHDAVAGLRTLDVPTLVVHGTADEMILPVNGQHVASLVPDVRLETMDGVGHLFWWEQPERSAELVRGHAR